ncbi:hypothetical protein [Nonomuraea insulae]|uniref:ABC transmembrane type-1 domain-containing protein n=1 Tax=Nonomuraea insulae TaxID=1616787 RepID=A0ABW1D551_9ACTN
MADESLELGEITISDWHGHADKTAEVRFRTIARRLPSLVHQALSVAWKASPRDTLYAITLNVLGGVFTAFGLLATTGVLTALFTAGPTIDRVMATLPSLALVASAAALRAVVQAGAGWAQSWLNPQIARLTEEDLYSLTSQVTLVSFDDPDFHDSLERATSRGMYVASTAVASAIDMLTAAVGRTAVAGVLGVPRLDRTVTDIYANRARPETDRPGRAPARPGRTARPSTTDHATAGACPRPHLHQRRACR